MGKKPINKMPTKDRAKQFMPFSALRGLSEALAQRERIVVARPTLSEDRLAELDDTLHSLAIGMIVKVIYFSQDEYIQITGMFAGINEHSRLLRVVNTSIPFSDIIEINVQ